MPGTLSRLTTVLLVTGLLTIPADTAAAQNPDCSVLAGNLVKNCSFEDPAYGAAPTFQLPVDVTDWANTGQFERWINGYSFGNASPYLSREGSAHLELDSYGNTTIWQYISTVVGQTYDVYFSAAHRTFGQSGSQIGLSIDDVPLFATPLLTTNDPGQFTWVDYQVTFTATAISTKLGFSALGPSDTYGDHLDNIAVVGAVAIVPEPGTYVLMAAGLAAMAVLARRRRRPV